MYIDTKLVFKAMQYYEELGYTMMYAPLVVDVDVAKHTSPIGAELLYHSHNKVYVGSAEQSFIQLHKEGRLPVGKYMALTPCNRDERVLDETHYLSFLKLELIIVGVECSPQYTQMIKDCYNLFRSNVQEAFQVVKIETTEEGTDIVWQGVEIGSYGQRKMLDGTPYIYGTGLAEPRFTYACNLNQT